jgi:hypothetical protein
VEDDERAPRVVQVRGIDPVLWRRVRAEAVRRDWTMATLLELALRQWLNGKAEASA